MTTGILPTTLAVSLSHDGSTWVDVTSYLRAAEHRFQRGRNRVLGEWVPGTFSIYAWDAARSIDPTNDAATFQPRPGDEIKIAVDGVTQWRGRVGSAVVQYVKTAGNPVAALSLSGFDGLTTVARATVSDLGSAPAGYGTFYTGALVDLVLALSDLNYANAATTDTGDVATSLPDTGTLNALTVLQGCTRTEGGNAQLFTLKDGTLRWRSRYARPSQVVTFGGSGVPCTEIEVAYTDDEWANSVNLTISQHVDYQSSVTSVTTGTGTKNFTLDALPSSLADGFGFSAGAAVYIESDGAPSNNMTGTVTSFDESTRALVTSIASKNGTATRTDWTLTFTEPSSVQSAKDAQSRTEFSQYVTADLSTYHRNATAAAAEATLLAAQRAWPSRRIQRVTVDLGAPALSAGNVTSVLGLEIGDAADVSLVLGSGSPSTLRQVRQIDGIQHRINGGTGQHFVDLTLGVESLIVPTVALKQNGSTVTSSTGQAYYTVRDGWCVGRLVVTASASGSAGEMKLTPTGLPTPAVTGHLAHGTFTAYDLSTTTLYAGTCGFDGTDIRLRRHGDAAAFAGFTIATGDVIGVEFAYPIETAASWTPTLKQNGTTVAATVTSSTYTNRDGRCTAQVFLSATAAGTVATECKVSFTGLPTPANSSSLVHGTFTYNDAGTFYTGAARISGSDIRLRPHNLGQEIGQTPSFAVASGDTLSITLDYPV